MEQGSSTRYYYDSTAGAGTNVYVIDPGIRITHNEFSGGRAVWEANFIKRSPNMDEVGLGTHVAGIVGGKTYGVARKCNLTAVKMVDKDASTTISISLQGLRWAVNVAKAKRITKKAVINISGGDPYSSVVNDATKAQQPQGSNNFLAYNGFGK